MQQSRRSRLPGLARHVERPMAALGVLALAASGVAAGLAPVAGTASSHREAPLTSGDPRADNTDVYAFTSPDKPDTVTLIADWIPFEEPNGGPNFYPFAEDAHYNIKIDSDGDGKPDTTYTWKFTNHVRDSANQFLYNTGVVHSIDDKTLNFRQTYTLTETSGKGHTKVLLKDAPVAPSDVGKASMPDYAPLRQQAITSLPRGGKSFAGQSDDPFFLDLRIFDLLYGGNLKERGHDTLAGYNVNTIALQVPKKDLALGGDAKKNPVIGIWSTTDRKGTNVMAQGGGKSKNGGMSHSWHQVSRLGNPLVNEVVVPYKYKDAFNSIPPVKDHTIKPVVDKVKDPIVPKLVQKIYGIPAPATPRKDLTEIFLTGICKACGPIKADLNSQLLNAGVSKKHFVPAEELRLNMSVPPAAHPKRLGVLAGDLAGFPNGRRLTDDVVDIELQALEGAAQTGKIVPALAKGDKVNRNDRGFGDTFPYVALPHDTAVNRGDSDHPGGAVGAGLGGTSGGFPLASTSAMAGGLLLAGAGALALWRRRTGGPALWRRAA